MVNEVIIGLEQVGAYFDDVIVFDSDPMVHVQNPCTLRVPTQAQPQALVLEGSPARLGRWLSGSLHLARVLASERGKIVSNDQNADAPGFKADSRPDGWCGVISQIFARLVQADPSDHLPSQEGGHV